MENTSAIKLKLWAVFFIQLNEGFQLNVILPFVVFMVRDFNVDEDLVGLYTGLLIAAFNICQFICSFPWGYFSDIYGRRISLLLGLFFSGIAIIIFGASKTYSQAIIARSITGLFNGNVGVLRAYISDITDKSNRAFAFSIISVAFSIGLIFGSTIGGVLITTYNVIENEDGTFTHKPSKGVLKWSIFEHEYPYLLPCVIGAIVTLNSVIWTIIFVKEEKHSINNNKNTPQNAGSISMIKYTESSISLPVLPISDKQNITHSLEIYSARSLIETSQANATQFDTSSITKKFKKNTLIAKDDIVIESVFDLFKKTQFMHGLFVYSFGIMWLMLWNVLAPLFLAQSLDFNSLEIGIYMAWNGVVLLVFTLKFQPYFLKKYLYKTLVLYCGIGMTFICFGFPSITFLLQFESIDFIWIIIITCAVGGTKFTFGSLVFVSTTCFLNNSVPPLQVGRANGIGQASAAFLRGIGPIIGGAIWSWSMIQHSDFAVYAAYAFCYLFIIGTSIYSCLFIDWK
eukprot:279527_1